MKTVAYTSETGNKFEFRILTNYLLDSQGKHKASGEKQVFIEAFLNGNDESTIGGLVKLSTPQNGIVGKIGRIGLNQDRYNQVKEAIDAMEKSIEEHNRKLEERAVKLDALGNGDINSVFGCDC